MYEELNQIFEDFLKNEKLIKEVKKLLNFKKSLNEFTTIPIDISENLSESNEEIFQQFLLAKMLAQTSLNLSYNNIYYKSCTMTKVLDIIRRDGHVDQEKNDTKDIDPVIRNIVHYIVLFHILSQREAFDLRSQAEGEKRKSFERCDYCDTEIEEDAEECSICGISIRNKSLKDNKSDSISENKDPINDRGSRKDKWTCLSCTFINKASNKECGACSTLKLENTAHNNSLNNLNNKTGDTCKDTWTCFSCTFINKASNKECGACGRFPNLIIQKEDIKVQDTWKCTYCLEDNAFHKYICQTCHKQAPFFRMWRCANCSHFNDEKDECCKVCNDGKDDKKSSKKKESRDPEDIKDKTLSINKLSYEEDWIIVESSEDLAIMSTCNSISCADKGGAHEYDKSNLKEQNPQEEIYFSKVICYPFSYFFK